MPKTFELHYHISDNGDGSASVWFHLNEKEAEEADEAEEGWGESCNSSVTLMVKDDKLYYRESGDWVEVKCRV